MCGIAGFLHFNRAVNACASVIKNMTDAIAHRGPDGEGAYVKDNVVLGHRRLAIIDLSAGQQPIYSDDNNIVIVFNGKIYNYKEINDELIKLEHSFHSNSDTEVIIKAYQQYGIAFVYKFIGMFAFAMYDFQQSVVYLLRDRAGVKPLYYFRTNDVLVFASELKAIYAYPGFKKDINEDAITLFFKYGNISTPHTIFKQTYKVQAGHYLNADSAKKNVEEIKYNDVLDYYNKLKIKIDEEEDVTEIEKLFSSAFQYRMVRDVPVGVFLSGGYDSSLVAGVLQKNSSNAIKTFTIGFNEEKYNEAPHAKVIAGYLGIDHHEYYYTTKGAQEIFPLLPEFYDEPFGDRSAIPTILISWFAKSKVTVSLLAFGGDELFAGYKRYQSLEKINKAFGKSPDFLLLTGRFMLNSSFSLFPDWRLRAPKINKLSQMLNGYDGNAIPDLLYQYYSEPVLKKLLIGCNEKVGLYDNMGAINEGNDFMNSCVAHDYKTYMVDDILTKVDEATMSIGLEGREPLLDHRIIEFVAQLPSNLKYNKGEIKYLLKKITHKYVPKELLDRSKSGFSLPVHEWLKN